jgi:biotin synthase
MCYAIPAKLIEICDRQIGIVEYFGETRRILIDLPDIKVGDYVYAQGGISIRKVPKKEALDILETWKEIFFELKQTDQAISKLDESNVPENILSILQKVNLRQSLKPTELKSLFGIQNRNELKVLYEIANNVRQREHGNASCVHGILEFSNYCNAQCHYCGIRKPRHIHRYRMTFDEIMQAAKHAIDTYGFKALVLQSGEDRYYTTTLLIKIVRALRQLGILVFLSIGDRSAQTYQDLYQAGARAALMRFETSNETLFSKIKPGTTLQERLNLIDELKKIGYILASGFIIGLPGETHDDCIRNILLTKQTAPDMYSFGPLIPTKNTPLAHAKTPNLHEVLKTIALTRLTAYSSNILVTSALETLDPGAAREGLLAGANSMMINITPEKYKKLYTIYDHRKGSKTNIEKCVQETVDLLYSLGRSPTDLSVASR